MSAAWQMSIDQGMGVFAPDNADGDEVSPMIVADTVSMAPIVIETGPHAIWTKVNCLNHLVTLFMPSSISKRPTL
ncbi:unnamed protein product [Protopolystoma xenopodis]|uniref:Uncharacterized protein n=1 Tax=Protopolystoma xenopodis TaxID=117903 RepID=A0A3S5AUC8_9PLAT|nr:unnamed protein product [Protopolystoma xenopodis]